MTVPLTSHPTGIANHQYLVMDLETTGLEPKNYDILTLYMAVVNVLPYQSEDFPFKYQINPKKSLTLNLKPGYGVKYRVDPEAMAINKIDLVEHMKISVTVEMAALVVTHFLKKASLTPNPKFTLIGWNPSFDADFMFEHMPVLQSYFNYGMIDVKSLAMVYHDMTQAILSPKANLTGFANHFGLDTSNTHTADGDCKLTIDVLNKIVDRIKI